MGLLENEIAQRLVSTGRTVSVAESCTGGLLGAHLTNAAGSSRYFKGGIIAYENEVKSRLLGIPAAVVKRHGAVSAPVARGMAKGVRLRLRTTYGIGITGIAGPGGGTPRKPVGLVFIAIATPHNIAVERCSFTGTRLAIRKKSVHKALRILRRTIDN